MYVLAEDLFSLLPLMLISSHWDDNQAEGTCSCVIIEVIGINTSSSSPQPAGNPFVGAPMSCGRHGKCRREPLLLWLPLPIDKEGTWGEVHKTALLASDSHWQRLHFLPC